jgi:hypothetical protein
MERTPVNSSAIATVAYAEETQTLTVEFNDGGSWEYYDVPQGVVDELMRSPSVGSYFVRNVRNSFSGSPV